MINHNDHVDRRAMLVIERDALIAENEMATSWGAAVGARAARIAAIDRFLAKPKEGE